MFYPLLAAITFFTRIPMWKLVELPGDSFRRIIPFWPLTGWITGATSAFIFWFAAQVFPVYVAVLLAFSARIALTGALHEDGLGDFFDGFGGGKCKEDILRIMKDSHTGSYAIIGLILYFLLLTNTVAAMPAHTIPLLIFAADPFSKMVTALFINRLPYSRKEEESKSKTIYDKLNAVQIIVTLSGGILPLLLFPTGWQMATTALLPIMGAISVSVYVKRKIGGYTGDICGATALLCELLFYVGALAFGLPIK